MEKHTQDQKYEAYHNDLSNTLQNHNLSWRNRNIGMEHMLLKGSRYGWNQCFYKRKAQVLKTQQWKPFQEEEAILQHILEPYVPVFETRYPDKTQVENRLNKLFDFLGQNIYVSYQDVFFITDTGLHDE